METYPLWVNTREQGLHAYHSPNEISCIITAGQGPRDLEGGILPTGNREHSGTAMLIHKEGSRMYSENQAWTRRADTPDVNFTFWNKGEMWTLKYIPERSQQHTTHMPSNRRRHE